MLLSLSAHLTPQTVLPALSGPLAVFHSRADGTRNSEKDTKFSATTWIPIIVLCVFLMIFSILACLRTSLRRHIASMDEGATVAAGSRELQLARSTNRSLAAHPHRSRHPRRTPSQISTVSLPAYMKEPGDQELVVSRGPDAEDLTTPQAPADDDDHTADDTYLAIPPPRAYPHMPRLPTESSLLVGYSTTPDPRGDAPAYFEVVEQHRIGINDYPPNIPPPQRGFLAPIFSSPPPPSPTRAPTPPPSPPRPPRAGTRDRGPGTSGY